MLRSLVVAVAPYSDSRDGWQRSVAAEALRLRRPWLLASKWLASAVVDTRDRAH